MNSSAFNATTRLLDYKL